MWRRAEVAYILKQIEGLNISSTFRADPTISITINSSMAGIIVNLINYTKFGFGIWKILDILSSPLTFPLRNSKRLHNCASTAMLHMTRLWAVKESDNL